MSGVLETPYIPPLDSYVLPKDSLLFVEKILNFLQKCQEVHSRLNPVKSCAYILSLNVVVPIIIYPKETHNLHQKVSVQYSFFEVVVCSGYKIS